MRHIAILGREYQLGIAELEALHGPSKTQPIGMVGCWVDTEVDFKRLGSSTKLTSFIETAQTNDLAIVLRRCQDIIRAQQYPDAGKLKLGFSVYGTVVTTKKLTQATLELKKSLKKSGYSLRLVPNKAPTLNAAQILRNKLTHAKGLELNLIFDGGQTHITRTTAVQDIDEYTRRDREKPVRDPQVGMLPPKLAQTLINLTSAQAGDHLLDPFCGTGTVLIEAHEMNMQPHGSDISPEMVAASQKNLSWYGQPSTMVVAGDATSHIWDQQIDAVAAETYLGPPLRSLPEHNELKSIMHEVDEIHRDFLKNLARQIKRGTHVALAIPAWRKNGQLIDLPLLDDLESLGYNRMSFEHVRDQLAYFRPNQVVARRILVMTRA